MLKVPLGEISRHLLPSFFFWYEIINTDGKGTIFRYLTEVSELLSAKLLPFRYIQEP